MADPQTAQPRPQPSRAADGSGAAVIAAAIVVTLCLAAGWLSGPSTALLASFGLCLAAGSLVLVWLVRLDLRKAHFALDERLDAIAVKTHAPPAAFPVTADPSDLDDESLGRLLAECQAEVEARKAAGPLDPAVRPARDAAARQQARLAAARAAAQKRVASGKLAPAKVKRT